MSEKEDMMQIVIEIPKCFYEYCKSQEDALEILLAVKNGIPLPKCHGRILVISEDVIKYEQRTLGWSYQEWIDEVGLSNAIIAIIEADKTESEEE